jgi:hypothetical protein
MSRTGRWLVVAWLGVLVSPQGVLAQGWRDHVIFTFNERARVEFVNWFRPPSDAVDDGVERYSFLGNQLRAGLRGTYPHLQFTLELQHTQLLGLPEDATLPAPLGNLGPGATYFAHTRDSSQGKTFVKQGHVTVRRSGFAATLGRFEVSDGLETLPGDPTLAWLKRSRLAERLVGPFGYTHVTRSFDGARFVYDRPGWNATAFAARPTRGGFEVSANREIAGVGLAGLAVTAKQPFERSPADFRLFYLYYEDRRRAPVKVDNRPLDLRRADRGSIRIDTWGGHGAMVREAGSGAIDGLVWGVIQTGAWGLLEHDAWAYALEVGYQWPQVAGAPWLRAGYNRSSGDKDPADRDHGSFFQVLPTARIYAQFPFFNLMNNEDLFVQLIAKPHPRLTVRGDLHRLRLTEASDLWYAGGGATNERVFGFSGIPSGGERDLAVLADLGLTLRLSQRITAYVYVGRAFGQEVVRESFAEEDATYGYLELTFRY